jgi:hypothetical protein
MPKPRTPTTLLALNGGLKHDPGRYENRLNEPQPDAELGDPPVHFDAEQKAVWNEVVDMVPAGVLTKADRIVLELAVIQLVLVRSGEATSSDKTNLLACLSRMALTPADRSRVQVAQKPAEDEWAAFDSIQ